MRHAWRLHRPAGQRLGVADAVALVAIFVCLAFVTRLVCLDRSETTVFWAANGAMVTALLLLRPALSVPALGACIVANVALNLMTRYSPPDSLLYCLLYCLLNVLVSVAVALCTRRVCGARLDLSRSHRLWRFALIAFGCSALEAALGMAIVGGSSCAVLFNNWLQWTFCDGFGLLISTPALLLCFGPGDRIAPGSGRRRESWLLLGGAVCLAAWSFSVARSPAFLLIYPLLVLTAFRAGPAWVLVSILLTSTIAAGFTAHGLGPLALLADRDFLMGQGMVQPFVISLFASAVPANAALGETRRARRRLLRLKDAIEQAATHDALTGLANRMLFRRRLDALLRGRMPFAMVFVDLDRFKEVNDTLGHQAGDQLLRQFAERMQAGTHDIDTVARLGGDEFALLCAGARPPGSLEALSAHIAQAARLPFPLQAGVATISASIGVAVHDGVGTASELMHQADLALYAAKASGRDRHHMFADPPHMASVEPDTA